MGGRKGGREEVIKFLVMLEVGMLRKTFKRDTVLLGGKSRVIFDTEDRVAWETLMLPLGRKI